jgi:hypothetical protein
MMYDISVNGFLPKVCCDVLPSNFMCFQILIDNLEESISDGDTFRSHINNLPTYDRSKHNIESLSDAQIKFMYSILTMIMNRYIWCTGVKDANNFSVLPAIIAVPLYEVCTELGIAISLTHASLDLWNWHLIDNKKKFGLNNIYINHSLTGDPSEAHFYNVMIAIEGISGDILLMIPRVHEKFNNDDDELIKELKYISEKIKESTVIIKKMKDGCVPSFFFNYLRIYLSGSSNKELPNGVTLNLEPIEEKKLVIEKDKFTEKYDKLIIKKEKLIKEPKTESTEAKLLKVDKDILRMKRNLSALEDNKLIIELAGGSAAQSTLIQVYDAFLGVVHEEEHSRKFLKKMKQYMPKQHRDYLEMVLGLPSLKNYVNNSQNDKVIKEYNNCLKQLTYFRNAHLELVHTYIMKFVESKDDTVEQNKNAQGRKGTGGTDPVIFCENVIADTKSQLNKIPVIAKEQPYIWQGSYLSRKQLYAFSIGIIGIGLLFYILL